MVIQDFSSKIVFLDTAPLIYFIEGNSQYQNVLLDLFNFNDNGGFLFITSSITLLEVLVKPIKANEFYIAEQYKNVLMKAPGIKILDVTASISERAARLRAHYNLRTPDAIQCATSISAGADYFFTNDRQLKNIPLIRAVTVGELEQYRF